MSALPLAIPSTPAAEPRSAARGRGEEERRGKLGEEARAGLTARGGKELAPTYFYDARGYVLFERICEQPEYYPARAERSILLAHADRIVAAVPATELVELGCGPRRPTRTILDAMVRAGQLERYVPLDVFAGAVEACVAALAAEHASLPVHGMVGDLELHLAGLPVGGARLLALMGNLLGSYPSGARRRLLSRIARVLGPGDRLLVGVDLVQDESRMLAAYDDAAGASAEFNRNCLRVLNRELGADFELDNFSHVASYDRDAEQVELRLRAVEACVVRLPALALEISFVPEEDIRTKISAKFTRARLRNDFAAAGLLLESWHTDPGERFALALASCA